VSTSIRTRFAASFLANFVRGLVSFLTGLLLARWLGPSEYGRMVFLLASFAAFRQLLDMGTSSAFFTFLSQKQRSARFIRIFWYWVAGQLALSLLLVCLVLPDMLIQQIWVGETRTLVVLALMASFMQGVVWTSASQMAEACRQTVRLQRLNTMIVLMHPCVLVALWYFEQLAIPLVFTALIVEWSVAAWFAARIYRTQADSCQEESGGALSIRAIAREYLAYCGPMIPYVWLAFAHDFADRWMLQHWGGAAEQAYFGVAQQFSAVALLAISSIMGVLWKEVAEAAHRNDNQRLQYLYSRTTRILYFVAAATACGLLPWSGELLKLTVGEVYAGGAVTLMLMLVYPVYQALGQVGGTLLYATANVRLQVRLNVFVMAASMIAAYVMLAPPEAFIPGLGMRSQGLAWKMVLVAGVSTNLLLWFIARTFGWKFEWVFQVVVLTVCASLGWAAYLLVTVALSDLRNIAMQMLIAGIGYSAFLIAAVRCWPALAGLSPTELRRLVRFREKSGK
jgi:O-antigen/teichoic acid export membrane protein